MLETRTLICSIKLDPPDLNNALLRLPEQGWIPAILESRRRFLQLAGLEEQSLKLLPRKINARNFAELVAGDIFFNENDLYYVITNPERKASSDALSQAALLYEAGYRLSSSSIEDREDIQPGLEIGIISPHSSGLEERLKAFATLIENTIRSSWDGSKTQNLNFDWREVKPGTPHLEKIIAAQGEKSGPKFDRAKLVTEECNAAQILASKLARETLIEISQAGFARERDILGKKATEHEELREVLANLKSAGLLNTEYLLECGKDGAQLARFKDAQQFESIEVKNLVCPFCNSTFGQEAITERYSLSELGRKMSRKSYWMTVWITEHLVKLGVPEEVILWNVTEASEEVDLLVEFLEQLWIFELKDKEFGSGNAHSFGFRQVRYHADKAFIITTEKVSRDARNVFEELARERSLPRSRSPIYIEGLKSVEASLREQVNNVEHLYAMGRISLIGSLSGYNINAVYAAKLKNSSKDLSLRATGEVLKK